MKPANINEPAIEVLHKNLKRVGDSIYRSECPKCHNGTLLVYRNPIAFELLAEDRCILCGQVFIYKDIEELRKRSF